MSKPKSNTSPRRNSSSRPNSSELTLDDDTTLPDSDEASTMKTAVNALKQEERVRVESLTSVLRLILMVRLMASSLRRRKPAGPKN